MLLGVSAQLETAFPPGIETQGDVEDVLRLVARMILELHKRPEYLGFLRMVVADSRQFPWIAEELAVLPRKLSPSLSCVRKELQPDKSEEDKRQGTYTTSICALAKKDHSNHRGSRSGDPDEACVDRCRRETLNGFGQQ
jgi:hypothetical protein